MNATRKINFDFAFDLVKLCLFITHKTATEDKQSTTAPRAQNNLRIKLN